METEKMVNLPLALPADTILAGKYVIQQTLGQGGFGITYIAEDYKTKEKVVMKKFFPDTMVTRGQNNAITIRSGPAGENFIYGKDCFLAEAKTLAEFIGNENIVRVICYFEENGTAYFAMEYIEGESFQHYIKSHGGKISWEEAIKILLPVMDALAVVHSKGIIHRDVTPDNIYITREGVVKLLDFGAARYSLGDKSRSLDVVLKHGFAPKEQYTRHGRQGPFTDVYTTGASFYYALTGKRPPDAIDRMEEDDLIPPASLGVAIPPEAEDAILKALNVQSADRFQDMPAFKNALMSAKESIPNEKTVQEPQKAAEQTDMQNTAGAAGERHPGNKKVYMIAGCASGVLVVLLCILGTIIVGNIKKTNSAATVSEDLNNSGVTGQSIRSGEHVIVDDDRPLASAEGENSGENVKTTEQTTAEETTTQETTTEETTVGETMTEDAEAEDTAVDDPYSFERLGYDYENEMEWDHHRYYVYDASCMTWEEALEDARSEGGYLVRINIRQYKQELLHGGFDPFKGRNDMEAEALTQFLGMDGLTEADWFRKPFAIYAGDVFLACSDGIGSVVDPDMLKCCLSLPTPAKMCSEIEQQIGVINKTNQDNYTGILLKCLY